MGSLTALTDKNVGVHLTMCESILVDDFILGTLRKSYNVKFDDVIEVTSKRTLSEAMEMSSVLPLNSDRWIIVVDVAKVKAHLKSMSKVFTNNQNVVVWLKTSNYFDFKACLDEFKSVNSKYMSFLYESEVAMMLKPYNLRTDLVKFVYRSYNSDPEAPLRLGIAISDGWDVKTTKDIAEILGISAGTVETFVLKLLKTTIATKNGSRTQVSKLIRTVNTLSSKLSPEQLRRQMLRVVDDLYAVKMMYLSGEIYDRIPKKLPPAYEDRRLTKYNRLLDVIKELPIVRLQLMKIKLSRQSTWYYDSDVVEFILWWVSQIDTRPDKGR